MPTLLVFLGVFGGLTAFGVIGLLVGPVLLALLLALFRIYEEGYGRPGLRHCRSREELEHAVRKQHRVERLLDHAERTGRDEAGELRARHLGGHEDHRRAGAGAFHDPFAGFELRAHGQVGYSRLAINETATHLAVELGVDVANEDYVEGVLPASAKLVAAQASVKFDHAFNESVSFADNLTAYEPLLTQPEGAEFAPYFTDLRVSNTATLSAKMTDRLSLNVSDTLGWRNEPVAAPEGLSETRSNVDNTLMIAFVASIL